MKRIALILGLACLASAAQAQLPDPAFKPTWDNHSNLTRVPHFTGETNKFLNAAGAYADISTVDAPSGAVGTIQYNCGGVFCGTPLPLGILKGAFGPTFIAAVPGIDYLSPTGSGGGLIGLLASQIGSVPAGVLKGSGGAFTAAVSATDYAPATSGNAILKGDGAGGFANAASGTDYAPATSGSALLKGSGSGGFSSAVAGTDYVAPGGSAGAIDVTTQAVDTNTTKAASTAFVLAQAAAATPLIDGTAAVGTSTRYARGDHKHPTDTTRAAAGANTDITSLGGLTTPLSIAQGGTGAATAALARSGLSAAVSGTNGDITSLTGLTTPLSVAQGGTGSATASGARTNLGVTATGVDTAYAFRANNLSDLASASSARTNLGLGSLAILNTINNGNWSGTALALSNGGTGQTTALGARGSSGLNVESGTGHGDSIYTILATDRWVFTNAAFTASRTWTLPAANAVNAGAMLIVDDAQGTVTATNSLIVSRAGSDTINGGTSFTIDTANARLILFSDGVSKWTAQLQRPYGTAAGQAVNLDSGAHLPAVDGSALTGLTKGQVGLGNVDNTSDTTKNAASVILTNKTIDTAGPNTIKVGGVTISAGQYPGIATNTSATAGNIGELISATAALGSVSYTNGSTVNLTSASLTAGEWDVSCTYYWTTTSTTNVTLIDGSVSTTSATIDSTLGRFTQVTYPGGQVVGATNNGTTVGPVSLLLSGTTTVYCTANPLFAASTMTGGAYLRARRVH